MGQKKNTLSLVLIVKNESIHLEDCLHSGKNIADEIIILDSGSTDDTLAIAKAFTDKIYTHTDWQGFGKQRQLAQSHATGDWILMLDADERIPKDLALEIAAIIKTKPDSIYKIPRLSWAFGDFIRHGGWYPDYVARLYPRQETQYNNALVHEKLLNPSHLKIAILKNHLIHYTYENLEHYLTKSAGYASAWAKQRHTKNKKASLLQGIGHGVWYFIRMYILKAGFLDGRQGLLLALLSAHSVFSKYAALWLMYQPDRNSE